VGWHCFSLNFDQPRVGTDTRVRLGVNNLTDERAPLCDCRFGYWSDAHRDLGHYCYLDVKFGL
jgi:hypothetical protein